MSARCPNRLPGRSGPCGTAVQVLTDTIGRVVWSCHRCTWQQAGRCWQCGVPRDKVTARASFCAACRGLRRRQNSARRDSDPNRQHERRVADRRRNRSEKRKEWRKAWLEANPDKVRRYKRKQALNPTPARRASEARHNACPKRQAAKREQALAAYYAAHPSRPQPVCRVCHASIPFVPPGRPKVRCDACVPPSILRTRKTAVAA